MPAFFVLAHNPILHSGQRPAMTRQAVKLNDHGAPSSSIVSYIAVKEAMPQEPVTPPDSHEDQLRELHRMLQLGSPALVDAKGRRLELPEAIYSLLKDIVGNMQRGNAIMLLPEKHQLTTQRAADLLGFSRPHLIKLLESGDLPHHKVGSHRRVYLKDMLAYAKRRDAERKSSLNRLAKEAFEAGLYDKTEIPDGGEDE